MFIYFQQAFYQQYNNKVKNTQQWCENNLINHINLMIHYNHIEILSKEICDVIVTSSKSISKGHMKSLIQ